MAKRFDFETHKDEIILMYKSGRKIKNILDYVCDNYGFYLEESVLRKKIRQWTKEG